MLLACSLHSQRVFTTALNGRSIFMSEFPCRRWGGRRGSDQKRGSSEEGQGSSASQGSQNPQGKYTAPRLPLSAGRPVPWGLPVCLQGGALCLASSSFPLGAGCERESFPSKAMLTQHSGQDTELNRGGRGRASGLREVTAFFRAFRQNARS